MTYLNDLHTNLEESIDYTKMVERKPLQVSKLRKTNTGDIKRGLKKIIRPYKKVKLTISNNKQDFLTDLSNDLVKTLQIGTLQKEVVTNNTSLEEKIQEQEEHVTTLKEQQSINFSQESITDITKRHQTHSLQELQWGKKLKKKTKHSRTNNSSDIYSSISRYKKVILVLIFVIFLGLLDKIIVQNLTQGAYKSILAVQGSLPNVEKTKQHITSAQKKLAWANILATPFSIIPSSQADNLQHALDGGKEFTVFLKNSTEIYENIQKNIHTNSPEKLKLTELLSEIKKNQQNITKNLQETISYYEQIEDLGSQELNRKLEQGKYKLKTALNFLTLLENNYEEFLTLLGEKDQRRYMVLLQNNDEIRPTGGFIGSVAFIEIELGEIVDIKTEDIYNLDRTIDMSFKESREKRPKSPEGISNLATNYALRDANYSPFFRKSAEDIKYFMDKTYYPIDGVIFINKNLITDLLTSIGRVESEALGETITAENFSFILSTLVEAEVFRKGTTGSPKEALFAFSKEFQTKLKTEKKYGEYLKIIQKHIETRDIVLYSYIPKENSLLWKMQLTGELDTNSYLDFNFPVYTSIAGNKSDRYLERKYKKTIQNTPESCDYLADLEIYHTHTFGAEEQIEVEKILQKHQTKLKKAYNKIIEIQGKGTNRSYTRVYLPKNTVVYPKTNQKVIEEESYKVVTLYNETGHGNTSEYKISYKIKNPDCKDYSYKFFKQPGIKSYDISFDNKQKIIEYKNITTDFVKKD